MFFSQEFEDLSFNDKRIKRRFIGLCENFIKKPGSIIRQAMPDSSTIKAAYRFFDNVKVSKDQVLECHEAQTIKRVQDTHNEKILVIQDTTYCTYTSKPSTKGIGVLGKNQHGDILGFCIHHALCVTSNNIPLGLVAQTIYTHGECEQKESFRWIRDLRKTKSCLPEAITICDRESDFFEFLVEAHNLQATIIVRATENRYIRTPLKQNLKTYINQQEIIGLYYFLHPKTKESVPMNIRRALKVKIAAPGRKKDTQDIYYNVIQVENTAYNVEWTLLTNMECASIQDMCEIVSLYAKRWHIENFHKTLKSCFGIEKAMLESFERLQKLITLLSVCAFYLYSLTHLSRQNPELPCIILVKDAYWKALFTLRKKKIPKEPPTLYNFTRELALLGGYLGRKSDPPPGFIVLHRGWKRLSNAVDLFEILCQ